jgi:hypothetical protein
MRIDNRSTKIRRTATTVLAMSVAAGALAVGLTTTGAAADPGATQNPFGSSSLLQSEDFNDVAVKLDTETVALDGGQALSACTGEEGMYDITKSDIETGATWTSLRNSDQLLTETTTRAKGPADTTKFAKKLTGQIRSCQHEPKGHWRFGKARTLKVDGGSATWFLSYSGDGSTYPTGGAAVVRNGNQFGIIELTSPSGDPTKTMKQLTAAAIQRLA